MGMPQQERGQLVVGGATLRQLDLFAAAGGHVPIDGKVHREAVRIGTGI